MHREVGVSISVSFITLGAGVVLLLLKVVVWIHAIVLLNFNVIRCTVCESVGKVATGGAKGGRQDCGVHARIGIQIRQDVLVIDTQVKIGQSRFERHVVTPLHDKVNVVRAAAIVHSGVDVGGKHGHGRGQHTVATAELPTCIKKE